MNSYPQELKQIIVYPDGPQVINAGPGTGKTEVIAARVAHLIDDRYIRPNRIMCVTFTNNAADEMKERIANYTNANISAMLVGTFHSICGHILGEYNHRRLIIPGFKILSESEAYWCLKSALSKDASPVETESIAEEISRFKRSMTGLDAYARSLPDPEQAARFKKLYKLYQKQLLLADSYDFDDLTREAVLSLQKDRQLLTKIATGFSYIFVDEYQDASHAEASLVRLLYTGCPNLCVVGDSRQAIFGWRGADPRLIEQFKKLHRGTISHKLCINHRSTKQIVETSNRLMAASTNRHRSISTPAGASDGKVTVTSYANERKEADGIASLIETLTGSGTKNSAIAILFRIKALARPIETALIARRIPYALDDDHNAAYYNLPEVRSVINLLKLANNPGDDEAAQNLLRTLWSRFDSKVIDKLIDSIGGTGLLSALHTNVQPEGVSSVKWDSFHHLVTDADSLRVTMSAACTTADMVETASRCWSMKRFIKNSSDAEEKEGSLQDLHKIALQYTGPAPAGVQRLIQTFDQYLAAGSDELQLMTIHKSKGKSFETVFMPAMEEGCLPCRTGSSNGDLEEERRICYVGMTRAASSLYLSYCVKRTSQGRLCKRKKSSFLDDMAIGK
jgi:DNA helicase-2/ATP-dependent DNA helicase PcrA